MTWLEEIGLSEREAARILAAVRDAADDSQVQSARIDHLESNIGDTFAVVHRWDYDGKRLKDYWVRTQLPYEIAHKYGWTVVH